MVSKHKTSIALSVEAKRLLAALAKNLGVSQSAVIELLIRERAKRERLR